MTPAPDREPRDRLGTFRAFMNPPTFTAESGFAIAARLRARVLAALAAALVARPDDDVAPAPASGGDGESGSDRPGRRHRRAGRRATPATMPAGRSWSRPSSR